MSTTDLTVQPGDDPNQPNESPETQQESALRSYLAVLESEWREWRDQEYADKFGQWERMAGGLFADQDRDKQSERSKLVTPLTQQAVGSITDEVDEAVLQSNEAFQLTGMDSPELGKSREEFRRRITKDGWQASLSDAVFTACVYGSAFGEIVLDDVTEYEVTQQGSAVGVVERPRTAQYLRIWGPRNVITDYRCSDIDQAQGIFIEEYVPRHKVSTRMATGQYKSVPIEESQVPDELDADQTTNGTRQGVQVLRYFGKVPRALISAESVASKEAWEAVTERDKTVSGLVSAMVTLVNGRVVSAAENPTMRKRWGVEHYKLKRSPGRLLGRGIPEEGMMMQRAADGVIRAHMDSLAVTSQPVTATDVTRFPKGFNFAIYTGRNIPVNGPVTDAIQRLDLGRTDPALLATEQTFERLFMQATGTMDSGVLPDLVKGGTDPTALVMALAGMIRKNRGRVKAFQERFLIPLLEEAYIRYVQFEPNVFKALNPKFEVVGTMGILEREYESNRIIKLLQTMGPNSPLVPLLLRSVIATSNTRDREDMLAKLDAHLQVQADKAKKEAASPDPQTVQLQNLLMQGTLYKAQAMEKLANARKIGVETELAPRKAQADMVAALSKNIRDGQAPDEFERRVRLAEVMTKAREVDQRDEDRVSNERIADKQLEAAMARASGSHKGSE